MRIQALNGEQQPLADVVASGFIRRHQHALYLYTCWHVVTGFDPYALQVGFELPSRRYLAVALQAVEQRNPSVQVIGGLQTTIVPLYEGIAERGLPLWEQDNQHVPHTALNHIGLFVPFWHDVVRIKLPPSISVSEMQVIDEKRLNTSMVYPGDKCLVVGYPYGFSALGPGQPTPIALTRFVASGRVAGRHQQFLIDGIGAPGMSGGPVYVERDQDLLLVGVYTGSIYPDHTLHTKEKVTALGTVADISLIFKDALPLVIRPAVPVPRDGT